MCAGSSCCWSVDAAAATVRDPARQLGCASCRFPTFYRGDVAAGGLVGAGASPDIQYRPLIAERSPDPCGDPRLGAPRHGVSGSDGPDAGGRRGVWCPDRGICDHGGRAILRLSLFWFLTWPGWPSSACLRRAGRCICWPGPAPARRPARGAAWCPGGCTADISGSWPIPPAAARRCWLTCRAAGSSAATPGAPRRRSPSRCRAWPPGTGGGPAHCRRCCRRSHWPWSAGPPGRGPADRRAGLRGEPVDARPADPRGRRPGWPDSAGAGRR